MPKICYVARRFNKSSELIIGVAEKICEEYMADGYVLTLRQLYYQFVARGICANTMKEYKRIGSVINDARLAGRLDWDAIEDRTRNLETLPHWDSPQDILNASAEQFRFDRWATQNVRIEIWVEKEALIGVIERIAHRFRVPYFACRGYASQSEVWRAGQRFLAHNENGQAVKILHLGDHDPSGIDMTRDNDDRVQLFTEQGDVEVTRLALNMDQVNRYNPPPNPAKLTDKRATKYIKRFGRKSWELDALDPKVIDAIVSREIQQYIHKKNWDAAVKREDAARAALAMTVYSVAGL